MPVAVAPAPTLAVSVEPAVPKLTPLAFEYERLVCGWTLWLKLALAVIVEPTCPNVTLFEFENETEVWLKLAVMTDEFDIPNDTPFELLKTTVPLVAVCVPAAFASVGCTLWLNEALAVSVDPTCPKLTLLLFE